jgi:L-cysteate sulfo-lyase
MSIPPLNLGRVPLAHLPTPVEAMPRLSRELGGATLWVKRDDQTGLAGGGNKTRKLEFLVADALAQGADTLVTAGAAQSNHCRQTAAAAARAGLGCVLVLGGQPPDTAPTGNLLLDTLLGAEIRWAGPHRRGEELERVADELRAAGRRPYVIPYGGSNALGASAYALAMHELAAQLSDHPPLHGIDRIVVASSSGATQAGLVVGARRVGYRGQVLGIAIDKGEAGDDPYPVHLARLATATARRLKMDATFAPDDFAVNRDYLGGGYGVVGAAEREAIHLAGRCEGLLVDPVYTGRALAGLIDLVRRGEIGAHETVLFWHTGGLPSLFAYADALV